MAKFDTALEDIVKANRQKRAAGKNRGSNSPRKNRAMTMPAGRRGGNRGGNRGNSLGFRARSMISRSKSIENLRKADDGVTRLSLRNLDYAVNDKDLKELFSEFGGLRRNEVHYDRDGRSQGSAELVFMTKRSALAAKKQYNGVPLDGRPMEIEIIGDKFVPEMIRNAIRNRQTSNRGNNNSNRGFRGTRGGRNRNNNSNNGRKDKKEEKTAEQLDKELDNYLTKGATTTMEE